VDWLAVNVGITFSIHGNIVRMANQGCECAGGWRRHGNGVQWLPVHVAQVRVAHWL
jgi:hypothetical protein